MSTKGGRLTIQRSHLIQMASDPAFYVAVPTFIYLKDAALTSWQMYKASKGCRKCGNEWKYMHGICDAMFMKLREMKETNDPGLADIKEWLTEKKGYKIDRVTLYYRRSRKQKNIAKLKF